MYEFIDLTNSSSRIHIAPVREWDRSGRRVGNPEKSKNILGFESNIGLITGIVETIEWTKSNIQAIKSAINQHESSLTFKEK